MQISHCRAAASVVLRGEKGWGNLPLSSSDRPTDWSHLLHASSAGVKTTLVVHGCCHRLLIRPMTRAWRAELCPAALLSATVQAAD